ncbi:MAG: hypothetical protein U5J99_10455 [Parvularculaceae bacterium]|nr:hypothetical protein [Parvularculaceae bacterium]
MTVSAALLSVWTMAAVRARPKWQAFVVGLAMLLIAAINGAAPVRGLVDPDYIGFHFGRFAAEKGLAVTIIAGGVFLLAAAGAFDRATLCPDRLAVRHRPCLGGACCGQS